MTISNREPEIRIDYKFLETIMLTSSDENIQTLYMNLISVPENICIQTENLQVIVNQRRYNDVIED